MKKRQNEANQIVNDKHKLKFLCKKEAPIQSQNPAY